MSTSNPVAYSSDAVPQNTTVPNNSPYSIPQPISVPDGVVSPQPFIQSLPNRPSDLDPSPCPICLSEESRILLATPLQGDLSAPLKQLVCGHCFHGDCLLKWLQKGKTCPMCRFNLGVDPECPDLSNARWARMGSNEWRMVGDGPGQWTLRRSVGNGPDGGFLSATSLLYIPTTPVYRPTVPETLPTVEQYGGVIDPSFSPTIPDYHPTDPLAYSSNLSDRPASPETLRGSTAIVHPPHATSPWYIPSSAAYNPTSPSYLPANPET